MSSTIEDLFKDPVTLVDTPVASARFYRDEAGLIHTALLAMTNAYGAFYMTACDPSRTYTGSKPR